MMRLDKLLSHAGWGSRKQVRELIRKGRVQVNGQTVRKDDLHVDELQDQVTVEDKQVSAPKEIVLMLHKPAGVVSAIRDDRYPTVMDCVGTLPGSLFPVGRLDRDTTGLLLITNNGALAHDLLAPKKHVEKTYEVVLKKDWDPRWQTAIEQGLTIDQGEVCRSAHVCQKDARKILLTLHEGKYHQVKRMMLACDNEVAQLKRIRFGPLMLDEALAPGQWRFCSEAEIRALKQGRSQEERQKRIA